MNFLHAEPILIGMYVCCLWGGGKVPISANRNTSGPQPRWLRRCTNILEIHQTRKTNRNAPRKLETHHQSPHQSSIHGCKNKFYWLQKFCFTSFQKQDISASIQALTFVPPSRFQQAIVFVPELAVTHCVQTSCCLLYLGLCFDKVMSQTVFWQDLRIATNGRLPRIAVSALFSQEGLSCSLFALSNTCKSPLKPLWGLDQLY